MAGIPNTIIIESNRQIAYKQEEESIGNNSAETIGLSVKEAFPNNKWRTHLEFGQQITQGDEISLEAAMINDIGGGDEVMEFIGKTGVVSADGASLDDSRMRCEFGYYVNNRYQFNFIHPKSTYVCNRSHLNTDYGGPNVDGQGRATGGGNPTDLEQFATFRDCYPYQTMEGFYHNDKLARTYTKIPSQLFPTFMKPNANVFNPSDQKFFVGDSNFTGPYFYPGEPEADQSAEWTFATSKVDLEVPIGFSTPAAVGERLTAQLHQRDGAASNWAVNTIPPRQFSIDPAAGTITTQIMPGISDNTYQTFPTAPGALLYARTLEGNEATSYNAWSCSFEGEKFQTGQHAGTLAPVGTGYQGNQGRTQFWKNTLCENINEWQGHTIYSRVQRQPFVMTDIVVTNPTYENQSLYTGPTQIRQFTHGGRTFSTGFLGCAGSVLLDETKSKTGSFSFTNSNDKLAATGQYNNTEASLWDVEKNDAIAMNMVLNDFNMNNTTRSFDKANYIFQSITNVDPQSDNYKAGVAVNFVMGRIDDERTLSSANRIIYLANPNMIFTGGFNGAPITTPYTTMAGSPTEAPTEQAGFSYTIDMPSDDETGTPTDTISRLYGGARESSTRYEVPVFCYTDSGFNSIDAQNDNLTNHKGEQVARNLFPHNPDSLFQTSIPNGNNKLLKEYYTKIQSQQKGMGLGMIPVFYKAAYATGANANLLNVPFLATIVAVSPTTKIPRPSIGEFYGLGSPTLTQNNLGKLVTTQKTNSTTYPQVVEPLVTPPAIDPEVKPESYMPYVYCGASDSLINFDGGFSRFTLSQFHTAVKPGNGVFQDIDQLENATPETDSLTSYEQEAALCTIGGDGVPLGYKAQVAIPRPQPIISAQSGVALLGIKAFLAEGRPIGDSTTISLTAYNTQQYTNTLFDKLGFSFEQLMPEYGLPDNEFNRGNYNRFLGFTNINLLDKQENMVKPFTTNAYISASIIISMAQGIAVKASDATGTDVQSEGPVPSANMGALIARQATTNASSDLLIGVGIPQKLDYPYLVVYTDIVRNPLYYGGADGSQKLSAIAYITRNYASGDFFYSFATGWNYTADQDYIITDITTDIRLPDGSPAPIDKNSSVIYKIQTTKAMPPPPQVLSQALIEQAKLDKKNSNT